VGMGQVWTACLREQGRNGNSVCRNGVSLRDSVEMSTGHAGMGGNDN